MIRSLIICVFIVTMGTDGAQSTSLSLPEGFSLHQVIATWHDAYEKCQSEGAILASPVNEELLNIMKSVMNAKKLTYHIGTRARITPGKYVSIEGVALESMGVILTDMVQQLNPGHGDCLAMSHDGIHVVSCRTYLPYICYNIQMYNQSISNNGSVSQDGAVSKSLQLPDGYTFHPVMSTWQAAYEQCQNEGAILASPVTEEVLNIMKSVMNAKKLTYHIGTRARSTPGKYVSIEGVELENVSVVMADMVQELNPTQGDCLAMDHESIRVIACRTELPYLCYKPQIRTSDKPNCGPEEQGFKYDESQQKCYKVYSERMSWYQAEQTCVDEEAHLVVIENESKATVVRDMFPPSAYYVWTGIREYTGEGDWQSVHGQRVEDLYDIWYNNNKPSGSNACGGFNKRLELLSANCNTKLNPFICEKAQNY